MAISKLSRFCEVPSGKFAGVCGLPLISLFHLHTQPRLVIYNEHNWDKAEQLPTISRYNLEITSDERNTSQISAFRNLHTLHLHTKKYSVAQQNSLKELCNKTRIGLASNTGRKLKAFLMIQVGLSLAEWVSFWSTKTEHILETW